MPRALALATIGLLTAACGGPTASTPLAPGTTAPAATAPSSAAPSAPPGVAATAGAGGQRWTVTDASKATVSVREQLAGFSLPSDAALTASGARGAFAMNDDGTFTADSKITLDLSTLASDSAQRDSFVKNNTLGIRQFPTAEFVPDKVSGVALPLRDGAFSGTLTGRMTIRGITKDLTFSVKGTRTGAQLMATATAEPPLTFGQFGMTPPTIAGRVLSIVDAIHLAVDIVATRG